MNILSEVIASMNKEEIRHLKLYLNRTRAGGDRMDMSLFDHIRKNYGNGNTDDLCRKMYRKKDRNAFYRLRNRLLDDITKSMNLQHNGKTDEGLILGFLSMARIFRDRNRADIALYYIRKAEKKAAAAENYEFLDLVYTECIKLSHDTLYLDPEEYIKKRRRNREKLFKALEIDDILAVAVFRIKKTQNFSAPNSRVIDLLGKVVGDYAHSEEALRSPALRFSIYRSVSRLLLQQRDYHELEDYLLKTYDTFLSEGMFSKENHDTKLEMLTYLANTLNKNDKTGLSLHYAAELKQAMEEYGGLLREKYQFNYYNALVNNYSKTNVDKAIAILEEIRDDKVIRKNPFHAVYILLNLAISYYGRQDYKKAGKNIARIRLEDGFAKLDDAFRLKICIVELMVRYETGDHDYVQYRRTQVLQEYRGLLNSPDYRREKAMLDVLSAMPLTAKSRKGKRLSAKMDTLLSLSDEEASEQDIISYNTWLQSRIG